MTRIKLCGLTRDGDIETANILKPDYIGFVFAEKSRRHVTPGQAEALKKQLNPDIQAVGVFVNEKAETVAALLKQGIIDLAQLHGNEDEAYLGRLRTLTEKSVIRAFRIAGTEDLQRAEDSSADILLLDAGAGGGTVFDWQLLPEDWTPKTSGRQSGHCGRTAWTSAPASKRTEEKIRRK